MRISIVILAVLVCCGAVLGETMYLDKDGTWKTVSSEIQSQYIARIAEAKQLATRGKAAEAAKAYSKLRKDFPQLESQGIGLFIESELLYARRDFVKAAQKYTNFVDEHPGSDLYEAAMDRLYQVGYAFLNGQKKPLLWVFRVKAYEDGEKIMNAIADRAGNAPIAQQGLISVAKSYESRQSYRDAYRAWSDVAARWPAGEIGRDALHGMALNLYKAYQGPKYEASSLLSSRGYYVQLKDRYPDFAAGLKVDQLLAHIDEQLAEKELTVARYYRRTGCPEGAELYLSEVLNKWPNTLAAEQAKELTAIGTK